MSRKLEGGLLQVIIEYSRREKLLIESNKILKNNNEKLSMELHDMKVDRNFYRAQNVQYNRLILAKNSEIEGLQEDLREEQLNSKELEQGFNVASTYIKQCLSTYESHA